MIEYLIAQKYEQAKKYALDLKNEDSKNSGLTLTEILYQRGQGEVFELDNNYEDLDIEANVFWALASGYQKLYVEKDDAGAFERFRKIYDHALDSKDKTLQKFALISLLGVYRSDVIQVNLNYKNYLKRFAKLIASKVDRFHYRMFLLNFELSNVHYDIHIDEGFIAEFDQLIVDLGSPNGLSSRYFASKGVFLEIQGKYSAAKANLMQAINLAGELPYLRYIKFRSYCHLAEIAREQDEFADALNYMALAGQYGDRADPVRSKYYTNFYKAKVYKDMGDWENAYDHLRISDSIGILLEYEKSSSEIAQLNTKYQTAEKERQILVQQKRVKEEQQRAKVNGVLLAVALLFIGVGSIIAVLYQKNTIKKRKLAEQQHILEQQKVENLLKEQELVSIDAMIAGQEKERQRVAHELHDDLGSLMVTVKLFFDNVKADKADPALNKAKVLLDEAYQKIRGMSHTKNSGVMASQGLLPTVRKMAKVLSETNTITVNVEAFGMEERLENSLELTIFRIVQELMTNIIKHANATEAQIHLTQHPESLNIIVEDNGKGMPLENVATDQKGMGLTNIEKRIELLDGNFTIDSVAGKGTSVLIDVPV
ncbi:MAG: sensor histidine kinase [Leeuwenhoekiella sp.]